MRSTLLTGTEVLGIGMKQVLMSAGLGQGGGSMLVFMAVNPVSRYIPVITRLHGRALL